MNKKEIVPLLHSPSLKPVDKEPVLNILKEPRKRPSSKDFLNGLQLAPLKRADTKKFAKRSQQDFVFGKVTSQTLDEIGSKHRQRQKQLEQAKVDRILDKEKRRATILRSKLFMEKAFYSAIFQSILITNLKYARSKQRQLQICIKAQICIATWYRKIRAVLRFRVVAALSRIQNLAFGIKMHLRRRKMAIRRIRIFFIETRRIHQLMVAKRKICLSVRLLQRGYRDYHVCTEARLQILYLLWHQVIADHRREKQIYLNNQSCQNKNIDRESVTNLRIKQQDDTDDNTNLCLLSPNHRRAHIRNWRKRKQELRWLAQHKLLAQKHEQDRTLADKTWAKIETRMLQLLKTETFQAQPSPPKQNSKPQVPDHAKRQLLTELLTTTRRKHQDRWCSQPDRIRYREGSKQYSIAEAKRILQIKYPSIQPTPVRKAERAMKEWPQMPFFLQYDDSSSIPRIPLKQLVRSLYDQAVAAFAADEEKEHDLNYAEKGARTEDDAIAAHGTNDAQRVALKQTAALTRGRRRRHSL